jgi:transcriptional regulator with XRE-family HTH domain
MPFHHLPNYLRTHRLRLGLSQAELALMFGYCESAISKYELCDVPRSVRLLVAAHIAFGIPPEEVFPGLYHEVGEIVCAGAAALDAQLAAGRLDDRTSEKRRLIVELTERANANAYHP